MKRLRSSLLIVAAAAVFSLILLFSSSGAGAAEFHVPKDYATIQDAITAATGTAGGGTVIVEASVTPYSGQFKLKNNVSLRGTETARTILDGGGGTTVTIDGTGEILQGSVTIQNFTFINASNGISISNNSQNLISVSVTNNVFQGLSGPAITELFSPTTRVANNTFYLNKTALVCDSDLDISNNIFSGNGTAISDTAPIISRISNNAFFNNSGDVVSGTSGTTGTNPITGDPLFVKPISDFHLVQGSPCIGSGTNGTDVGAYGGTSADTIPFPVSGLSITSATDTSIGLSWLPNNSYLVTNTTSTLAGGYNLYVGPAPGSYTGALTSSGTISSPINVGLVTSYTLTGLIPLTTPPAKPDTVLSSPRDSGLVLTWTAVPGATGYEVHYGISSPNENVIDTKSAATSYELWGLTNGQHYLIAVKAYAQQQYFFNVTAYDNQYVKGSATAPLHESVSLATNETFTQIGKPLLGDLSIPISDFPEALVTYPALPNTGGRCFIATAAYGYYSAPEVQALRAFRDRYLLASAPGRMFVEWYYRHGPAAAAFLNEHPGYKPIVRAALTPAVGVSIFLTDTSIMFKTIVFLVLGTLIAFGFLSRRLSRAGGIR